MYLSYDKVCVLIWSCMFVRLGLVVCVTMHVGAKVAALHPMIYLPPRGVADGNFMVFCAGLSMIIECRLNSDKNKLYRHDMTMAEQGRLKFYYNMFFFVIRFMNLDSFDLNVS